MYNMLVPIYDKIRLNEKVIIFVSKLTAFHVLKEWKKNGQIIYL